MQTGPLAIHEIIGGPHDGKFIKQQAIPKEEYEGNMVGFIWNDSEIYYYKRYAMSRLWVCIDMSIECRAHLITMRVKHMEKEKNEP